MSSSLWSKTRTLAKKQLNCVAILPYWNASTVNVVNEASVNLAWEHLCIA